MNDLDANPYTHVIITFAGSHYFITASQQAKLVNLGANDFITVKGSIIKGSTIGEVMTLEQYYTTYPDRKPAPVLPSHNETVVDFNDFRNPNLSKNGLASMIRGIERAIAEFRAEGKEPLKALALLEKAQKAYKERYENSRVS